ncbi:DedA family protein [Promicromonospora sp. NFX87]|uniref:DedA family protein n=1 Tax=Promicromonospora sp. NFX87 TaxID=3402691 RepID=UPI003AFB546D
MDWLQLAESLISSPWLYLVLIGISVLDAFLPVVPSEPVIVLAGVYAALGETNLALVVASVTLGVFLGDMFPYLVGRLFGPRLLKRLPEGTKRRTAHDWVARQLEARGGFFLVSTRFLPLRFLPTLSAGLVRYPIVTYMGYTAVAALAWSSYRTLAGYVGGSLFQDNELLAIGVGIGLALMLSGLIEIVHRIRARRASTIEAT